MGGRGYVTVAAGGATAMVLAALAAPLREILQSGTLYGYAAAHAARRTFQGRAPVYAVPLGNACVVVRHAHHGGWLAPLTRDLFLPPTRAAHELAVALRLRDAGVPTPDVVAYVVYRVGAGLRRVDVATREIAGAADLATILALHPGSAPERTVAWAAVHELIAALARAGAYHADLNVKNVLIAGAGEDGAPRTAFALDVDRVVWRRPGDPAVARANTARLERSARKRGLL